MSNNLKPGDKCIIINSHYGNEGKIVEVTGYFDPISQKWKGVRFVPISTVVVKSLGSRIKVGDHKYFDECPFPPQYLKKLPPVTIDIEEFLSLSAPS